MKTALRNEVLAELRKHCVSVVGVLPRFAAPLLLSVCC